VTGAVMAPRWTYIDPVISFSPMISFEVVIMALFGGAGRLFGPLLGAVPLVLLFEVLTATFPNYFSILLGVVFIVIVYFVPHGVIGLIEQHFGKRRAGAFRTRMSTVAERAIGWLWPRAAKRPAESEAGGEAALAVQRLQKTFGGLVAVDAISFDIRRHEIVGLIGPNGSGKTTVLNLISGALRRDAGEVRLQGRDIGERPAHRIAQLGIARTFQLVRVLGSMSCIENVIAGLAFRDPPLWGAEAECAAQALIERVGLADKTNLAADQLTYIDQKRLELARALASKPQVLLLDEWLAGLNPNELAQGIALINSLRDSGMTIILVEHVMDAIRSLCDRCIVMNAGRMIADGLPAAVLTDREVVRCYLGEADA